MDIGGFRRDVNRLALIQDTYRLAFFTDNPLFFVNSQDQVTTCIDVAQTFIGIRHDNARFRYQIDSVP